MKTSAKALSGVALSLAWLLAYAGGGAFLLARKAAEDLSHVSVYMPLVVFLWIIGFFVGHSAIEKCCSIFLKKAEAPVSEYPHFDPKCGENLPLNLYLNYEIREGVQVLTFASKSNDVKKETGKLTFIFKPKSIYKVPQHC